MKISAFPLTEVESYVPHALHRGERAWPETNCYIDVWLEVLNALGLDPLAALNTVFAIDFDGDQWTFFKPSHDAVFSLYGLDVQELNPWKSLLENALTQLRLGRIVLTEADAYYLPDTKGTDYRAKHTKTTIGIQAIDLEQRAMWYFHNAGYYKLDGEDFEALMRLGNLHDPNHMPFFVEFIRLDRIKRLAAPELVAASKEQLKKYLEKAPRENPVTRWKAQFPADVAAMQEGGMEAFHAYAFANYRQLGSAFEIAAFYLDWLEAHEPGQGWQEIGTHFQAISGEVKSMVLKTARTVATKRPVDFSPMLDEIEKRWAVGMDLLKKRF